MIEIAEQEKTPEQKVIELEAKLAIAQGEMQRLTLDQETLPPGWQAVRISENRIRINALDANGSQCYWILDIGENT